MSFKLSRMHTKLAITIFIYLSYKGSWT